MSTSILSREQEKFLKLFGESRSLAQNFYLTGGTALAAFYLHHRYSEDLDFFSEKEIDLLPVDAFLKHSKEQLGFSKIDFQQSYNRNLFFVHCKEEILKVEFTYFPFPRIEMGEQKQGIEIDSLLDIAVNKLFTIYQRTHARDYIDLYTICREKGFTTAELTKKARAKFDWHIDPLQLGAQFVRASEAKDYPRMIQSIDPKEWQSFFLVEAQSLKSDIIE